ncbi:MAG: hypothetical protein DRM97_01355 [Thermoprotei archaeon]|nr:MAG: hypothetical protein DRM97_01355 [Thermoprotei archaeon]
MLWTWLIRSIYNSLSSVYSISSIARNLSIPIYRIDEMPELLQVIINHIMALFGTIIHLFTAYAFFIVIVIVTSVLLLVLRALIGRRVTRKTAKEEPEAEPFKKTEILEGTRQAVEELKRMKHEGIKVERFKISRSKKKYPVKKISLEEIKKSEISEVRIENMQKDFAELIKKLKELRDELSRFEKSRRD